ncbi:hypothetical protein LTSEHVI_2027, partial [Salmonella enterica subsp. enterica serovar Hvittingfoss str. A4-620]
MSQPRSVEGLLAGYEIPVSRFLRSGLPGWRI